MRYVLLTTLLALAAGGAHAQTSDPLRAAVYRAPAPIASAVQLPGGRAQPMRPSGVAMTAIDHRFDRDGLDGSLGFLCGLQPSAATTGAAAAYGVDPHGRFLGLKLHMSFR